MTEKSRFWDGTTIGDATESPYDAGTEFAQVLMSIAMMTGATNKGGVFVDDLLSLFTYSPSANTVRTSTGRGLVYGSWYQNDANIDTTIPTPAASTRVDRIVLRKSWAGQTIRVTRIAGTEGAGAPAMTQVVGTTWDFPLCQVSITTGGVMTLTDQRAFANSIIAGAALTNQLVNGGFEVAQRGTGAFTTNAVYTMDRWQAAIVTSTASITQINSTIGTNGKSAQIVYTHAGGGFAHISQPMAVTATEYNQLLGKTLSFSVKVKSTVAGTIKAFINDSVTGYTYSTYNIGVGEETLTVTAPISATAVSIYAGIRMDVGSATAEVNDAMLTIGSVAADYQPLTPAEDLARCQRYYETWEPNAAQDILGIGLSYNAATSAGHWSVKVQKATVAPTYTVSAAGDWWTTDGAFSAINVSSVSVARPHRAGCMVSMGVGAGLTAGQASIQMSRLTTAKLTSEANP